MLSTRDIINTEGKDMSRRPRLGELLTEQGKIDEVQLIAALAHQRKWGKRLGECLVLLGFITDVQLAQTLAKALELPLVDLSKIESSKITREILGLIPLAQARAHRVVPLALRDLKNKRRLIVGTSDPTNLRFIDELQFKSGYPLIVMIAADSDIDWFIRRYYMGENDSLALNYISGISVVAKGPHDAFKPDPISSIFYDDDFTGQSTIGRRTRKPERR